VLPSEGQSVGKKTVTDDAVQSAEAVTPTDLFTFLIGSTTVGDADFIDPHLLSGDLRGDLRFKAKTILVNDYARQHLATEDLIAGFHIGEIQVGEHI